MTDTPGMVERVARAIAENVSVGSRTEYGPGRRITVVGPVVVGVEEAARAAIEAMMEPTKEMLGAPTRLVSHFDGEYGDYNVYYERGQALEVWQAMIKAALDRQS